MSDGSITPGKDSITGEPIDIISSYQIAGSDDEDLKRRISLESCPGFGKLWWNVYLQYYANFSWCCGDGAITYGFTCITRSKKN